MRRFKLNQPVVMGFIIENEQNDILLDPEANVFVESDGQTLWIDVNGHRLESTTVASAIHPWLPLGFFRGSK
jgi:hypothetical protein